MPEETDYAAMAQRARDDFMARQSTAATAKEEESQRRADQQATARRHLDEEILPELEKAKAGLEKAGFSARIETGRDEGRKAPVREYLTFTPKIVDGLKRRDHMREEPTVRFEHDGERCQASVNWNGGVAIPTKDISPDRIAIWVENALQKLLA